MSPFNAGLKLDVEQATEFKNACKRNGWTNADIKLLCQDGMLGDIQPVVKGYAKVEMTEYLLNNDANASVPKGYDWEVQSHDTSFGRVNLTILDTINTQLYLHKDQSSPNGATGEQIEKALKGKRGHVLNACFLDFLLEYPELIPDNWKGKRVCFWGTLYNWIGKNNVLVVRYIDWTNNKWASSYFANPFDTRFWDDCPAVLLGCYTKV